MKLSFAIGFLLIQGNFAVAETSLQYMCNEYNKSFSHFYVDGPLNVIAKKQKGDVASIMKDAESFQNQFIKDCREKAKGKADSIEEVYNLDNEMQKIFLDRCEKTYKDTLYLDACLATIDTYSDVMKGVASAHLQGKKEGELNGYNKCESTLIGQNNSTMPKGQRAQIQNILDKAKPISDTAVKAQ